MFLTSESFIDEEKMMSKGNLLWLKKERKVRNYNALYDASNTTRTNRYRVEYGRAW